MSSRPWMPLFIADFIMDTPDLDEGEFGVYMALLMLAWRREDAALPNDAKWLLRSLKRCFRDFHGHAFNRIVPRLFTLYWSLGADDKWRNKRLTAEHEKAVKRSANAGQSADKRWLVSREIKALVDAKAMLSQSHIIGRKGTSEGRKVIGITPQLEQQIRGKKDERNDKSL